jgi:CRP-like cAMP-binding protein
MSEQTIPNIIAHLQNSFLFRGLPEEQLRALAGRFRHIRLDKDEVLFKKGDVGDSLYMIAAGELKIVTQDAKGGELIINRCGPGETIGEMSLLDQSPRSAGVVALQPADVFQLDREAFVRMLDQRPDLGLSVIQSISKRLRFSTTYIEKAIAWSHQIAEGDYSFIEQAADESRASTDEDKAGQLLSAFFQMVKGVKAREEALRLEVKNLSLQIDQARRKQEVEEITSTDFYSKLKTQARLLREERARQEQEE